MSQHIGAGFGICILDCSCKPCSASKRGLLGFLALKSMMVARSVNYNMKITKQATTSKNIFPVESYSRLHLAWCRVTRVHLHGGCLLQFGTILSKMELLHPVGDYYWSRVQEEAFLFANLPSATCSFLFVFFIFFWEKKQGWELCITQKYLWVMSLIFI